MSTTLIQYYDRQNDKYVTVSEQTPLPTKSAGGGGGQSAGQVIKSETITNVGQDITEYSTPNATAYRLKSPSGNSGGIVIFLNADDDTPGDELTVGERTVFLGPSFSYMAPVGTQALMIQSIGSVDNG